ncbi:MAG: hypothetical protein RSE93_02840 [Oscillospiraceae bacterium]
MTDTIVLENKELIIPPQMHGVIVQGDNNCLTVKIKAPRYMGEQDLSLTNAYLKTISCGGRDDVLLEQIVTANEVTLLWKVAAPQTLYSGEMVIQLYFLGEGGYKWQSKLAKLNIPNAIGNDLVIPVNPSVLVGINSKIAVLNSLKEALSVKAVDNLALVDGKLFLQAKGQIVGDGVLLQQGGTAQPDSRVTELLEQQKINEYLGTLNTNRKYKSIFDSDVTFNLPNPVNISVDNKIVIYALVILNINLTFSNNVTLYKGVTSALTAGSYDIIFTYDSNIEKWGVNILAKGN